MKKYVLEWKHETCYNERDNLPKGPCIYIIYTGDRYLYVGKTENLHNRFSFKKHLDAKHHNKLIEHDLTDDKNLRIIYTKSIHDADYLTTCEKMLIFCLKPKLNINNVTKSELRDVVVSNKGDKTPSTFPQAFVAAKSKQ